MMGVGSGEFGMRNAEWSREQSGALVKESPEGTTVNSLGRQP